MSVNGIGVTPAGIRAPYAEPRQRVETERPAPHAGTTGAVAPGQAQRASLTTIAPKGTLPAEAPAGTDPELWAVLTNDERAFFARVGAMGPLTYGHLLTAQTTAAPVNRGGRLDVRA